MLSLQIVKIIRMMTVAELDKEDIGIAMFRINRKQKETEKLEFLGFKPIYECREWAFFHLKDNDFIWFEEENQQSSLYDELDREVLNAFDYQMAMLTGIGTIEVESKNFNDEEDCQFDTVYTKLIEDLNKQEKALLNLGNDVLHYCKT